MNDREFIAWSKQTAKQQKFRIKRKIYQANHYAFGLRDIIYDGSYQRKPAVLKIYNHVEMNDEANTQVAFFKHCKSKILTAPEVYAHGKLSPNQGWLIMERLPLRAKHFISPMSESDRETFLKLFLEYRKHFPTKPTRRLMLIEEQSAKELTRFRIARWMSLANKVEEQRVAAGKAPLLKPAAFVPRVDNAIAVIDKELTRRKKVWSHCHFKPKELFHAPGDDKYYLTDFAATHYAAEGYEFGFMIWADVFMSGDWRKPYSQWRKPILSWIEDIRPIARALNIKRYDALIRASILERCLGTILADITASKKPEKEQRKRMKLCYALIDELTKNT